METLTESQFAAADATLSAKLRATKSGTPERAAVVAAQGEWETANSLPVRTAAQRDARRVAIYAVAVKHGLVAS